MAACGVGVVLMKLFSRMGLGYKRISRRVGSCFLVIPDLRWEIAPRLNYGMACGLRIRPLRKLFLIYMVLLALRMLLLEFIWSFLVAPISGR